MTAATFSYNKSSGVAVNHVGGLNCVTSVVGLKKTRLRSSLNPLKFHPKITGPQPRLKPSLHPGTPNPVTTDVFLERSDWCIISEQ